MYPNQSITPPKKANCQGFIEKIFCIYNSKIHEVYVQSWNQETAECAGI